jgi:DNA-binding NtrC family response regulator
MTPVLVVDDDSDLRDVARLALEEGGYEVIEAPHGQAALFLLQRSPVPVVVLLDIVMPRVSGMDLLEHVDSDARLTRHAYLLWSASPAPLPPHLATLTLRAVPKPFNIEDMLDAVAEAAAQLNRRQDA